MGGGVCWLRRGRRRGGFELESLLNGFAYGIAGLDADLKPSPCVGNSRLLSNAWSESWISQELDWLFVLDTLLSWCDLALFCQRSKNKPIVRRLSSRRSIHLYD